MSFAATMKNIAANTNMPAGMAELAKKIRGEGNDSKFFTTSKKGETHELRQELADQSRDKKKDAVKKVIANMTVGKDVSMLFTDVVNCIQTADTQLKKLVYLYLINYAKSNPDLTILAVNTFVKDANDPNPLLRALSVRTMGCIRVDRITEYLCEPLRKCLTDEDPYVRKTAAICVAKLYDINPELVDEQGFLDMLRELISDSNPTVVANAVAALSEISENGGAHQFKITKSVLQKLLAALNECNEWGQVFVLDALANYVPADSREAEGIIERVTPRLQHANSAVVLSAVKVIMKFLEKVTNADTERALSRKMAPPLVTLLSTEPEIQYVALRNINLIVQKRPTILSNEIKVFFCKYNDPIYVKMEKLEIIIRLVSERNIEQVLLEFKEYATEVDVDFVRRSVRAIGRCAIKLNNAAEKCIQVLLELIQTKVNYIVQEAIVVIKDIFRKYPNQYESIIATLCENLDTLDEPEAKASMIWIIGEYAERIDNADELLQSFLDSFEDETAQVQLQLLTSTVKLFLKRPNETQAMVQAVLKKATEESDNPDLRDRGYVYWRLLSANPEAAKAVVLAEKPVINDDTFTLEPSILDELIGKISTLASVYHKLPNTFVVRTNIAEIQKQNEEERDTEGDERYDDGSTETSDGGASGNPVDLLDMGGLSVGSNQPAAAPAPAAAPLDVFGSPTAPPAAPAVAKKMLQFTNAQSGKGLVLRGCYTRRQGAFALDLEVENQSNVPVPSIAIQLNKSTFGVVPTQPQVTFPEPLAPGRTTTCSIPMAVSPQFVNATVAPNTSVQAALKNMGSNDVIYFNTELDISAICSEAGLVEKGEFINLWKGIPESNESYFQLNVPGATVDSLANQLKPRNIFYVAKRPVEGKEIGYFSFKTMTNVLALLEITIDGSGVAKVCVKGEQMAFNAVFQKMEVKETMARNEEKANAMLNRWTSMKMDMAKAVLGRRPLDPNECTNLADAERFRLQVIRIISRKVSEIQNASLGEHVIRDLNDTINKRIDEKRQWEKRILELGGTRYDSGKFEDGYDADGVTLQHGKGYKYFGAAKNLPGVRELFAKEEQPKPKKSRKDLYKGIEPDYYGHLDDDDGILVREEAKMQAKRIQEAIQEWERKEAEKLQAQASS